MLKLLSRSPILTAVFILLPLPSYLLALDPVERELMVLVRDRVELATSVYLPAGSGPWPSILSRTPYNKNGLRGIAREFVGRGYAFVAQDCRGKFKSKGVYDPFRTDHHDGYDAVEWVAEQEWSNAKVGMIGASALGITTHLAATQVPPHLLCAYVVVAPANCRRNTVYFGGAYRMEMNDGWLTMQGAPQAIAETLRHPAGDPYWDWRDITAFHSRIRIPIYEIGGWFDIFSQGTLDNFTGLESSGAGLAAGNQKVVMGPYAHGLLEGRLKFPHDRAGEMLNGEDRFRWFDRWLKGVKNGIDEEPPVRYYVLGDPEDPRAPGNEWRTAPSWPPPSRATSYFLAAEGKLKPEPPAAPSSSSYAYDPKSPVPTVGGANLILGGKGPMDQRAIRERQDYLRFTSEPLAAPLEVAGRIYADLFVESDAPDTDFVAKLVDVYPDGYEALILDGILRARYREGIEKEVFLKPGEVVPLRIDLWSTAIVFNRGHRIAVHVTSSNHPRFDANPNTGKALRADSETRVARNTIHHDADRPSRLLLPVIERGAGNGDRKPEGERRF